MYLLSPTGNAYHFNLYIKKNGEHLNTHRIKFDLKLYFEILNFLNELKIERTWTQGLHKLKSE